MELLVAAGLGRQLDPDLDLWKTAKPYLERWMGEQVGWRGFVERLKAEAPRYAHIFPPAYFERMRAIAGHHSAQIETILEGCRVVEFLWIVATRPL